MAGTSRFGNPAVVPDPTAGGHATNKTYVDGEISDHEAAANPHPQYLTETEADSLYAAIGSGGGGTPPFTYYVAANDASTGEKSKADAVCDGTADQVQIQAGITAVKAAGGGRVVLSPGRFVLSASITIDGTDDVDDEQDDVFLIGAGTSNSILEVGSGVAAGIMISKVAKCHVWDLSLEVGGASHGIASTRSATTTANNRSFWLSSFRNLQVRGPWDGSHTGYAFHFGSPFRSVFENLESGGCGNHLRMFSQNAAFNPGDCVVSRSFGDITGDNGRCYSIESTTADGNMNQIEFMMCEGIANGSGCIGIYLGGTGPVNHTKWHGINLEQFGTALWINNGYGNRIDGNYWELTYGVDGTTAIRFDADAVGNRVEQLGFLYTEDTIVLIDSNSTNADEPNLVEHIRVQAESSAVVTNSITADDALIYRWSTNSGPGTSVTAPFESAGSSGPYASPVNVSGTTGEINLNVTDKSKFHYRVTMGGARQLGETTGATDGQMILVEIIQDGTGGRVLTYDLASSGAWDYGDVIPAVPDGANERGYLIAVYSTNDNKFHILGSRVGF